MHQATLSNASMRSTLELRSSWRSVSSFTGFHTFTHSRRLHSAGAFRGPASPRRRLLNRPSFDVTNTGHLHSQSSTPYSGPFRWRTLKLKSHPNNLVPSIPAMVLFRRRSRGDVLLTPESVMVSSDVVTAKQDAAQQFHALLGFWVGSMIYGAYFTLFVLVLSAKVTLQGRRDRSAPPARVTPFTIVSLVIFILTSVYMGLNASRIFYAFSPEWSEVSNGQLPIHHLRDYTSGKSFTTMLLIGILVWLGDGLAIYRCFIIWAMNWWIVLLPIALLLLSIANGTMVAVEYRHPGTLPPRAAWVLVRIIFPVNIMQSCFTTGLIAFRIWRRYRVSRAAGLRAYGGGINLLKVLWIIVESAMIFAMQQIILCIAFYSGSPIQYVFSEMLVPSIGINPETALFLPFVGFDLVKRLTLSSSPSELTDTSTMLRFPLTFFLTPSRSPSNSTAAFLLSPLVSHPYYPSAHPPFRLRHGQAPYSPKPLAPLALIHLRRRFRSRLRAPTPDAHPTSISNPIKDADRFPLPFPAAFALALKDPARGDDGGGDASANGAGTSFLAVFLVLPPPPTHSVALEAPYRCLRGCVTRERKVGFGQRGAQVNAESSETDYGRRALM
ncbi:hypothetical protein DFP72DRAFT_1071780 [Ephemerocybe angulata]|uniref:Uncharacterized protein n=1 Tax=Ephemerocybe angulata TaxID=980116 RepID=A0A8H6HQJ8_9AGAR|nr:hypothetical protein DFP72DRAFT_1071780 [Tulosesus angulatus]